MMRTSVSWAHGTQSGFPPGIPSGRSQGRLRTAMLAPAEGFPAGFPRFAAVLGLSIAPEKVMVSYSDEAAGLAHASESRMDLSCSLFLIIDDKRQS